MHTAPTDLIVIGGGVLGTFHAYHALQMGLSVRLFERDQFPQGASVRNFGQVVPSGMDAKWQRYGRTSLRIYKSFQQSTDISVRQLGSVYLASDEAEMLLLEEMRAINQEAEYPSMLLTAEQCLKRYPGLRPDYVMGGLFFPEEITVDARSMIQRVLHHLSQKSGLSFHPRTLIQDMQVNGQVVTCLDHQGNAYHAGQVIICSGHEFKVLFPDLFAESDLEVSQLQMMETVVQPQVRFPGNILTGLSIRRYESFRACPSYEKVKAAENPDAQWKKWGVHILFKQSPDGAVVIGDSHHYADAKD
ncbi:MAG: TIGR03364 family FAD-dependent oxidoreductase, partial [Bacteroidota bacterium]